MNKNVSIDIDGVLNFYPKPWFEFITIKTNLEFTSKDEAKKQLGDELYAQIKDEYRASAFKENLPINEESVSFLQKLNEHGFSITISTSRPIQNEKYPGLFTLTERWLTKQNIPFDRILYKCDADSFYNELGDVLFHVDDESKYADMLSKKGIKVYLYKTPFGTFNEPLIQSIESLWQINDYESIF